MRFLEEQGKIQAAPFDMCVAEDAKLMDLSVKKMRDFVRTAREVGGFRLPVNVSVKELLSHLNQIRLDGITYPLAHGAVINEPIRFGC